VCGEKRSSGCDRCVSPIWGLSLGQAGSSLGLRRGAGRWSELRDRAPGPSGHCFEPALAASASDAVQPSLTETARLPGAAGTGCHAPNVGVSVVRVLAVGTCGRAGCVLRTQLARTRPELVGLGGRALPQPGPVVCSSPLLSAVFHSVSGHAEEEGLLLFIVPAISGRIFTGEGRGPGCRWKHCRLIGLKHVWVFSLLLSSPEKPRREPAPLCGARSGPG